MTASLEDIKTIDITEWLTLATAPSPTKLKTGQTPYAYNTWVDEKPGSVITAPGYIKVGRTPSNSPGTFCINYFKTSAGTQTFVVSDNSTVWTTVDFQTFTPIVTGLSALFQLRGAVIRDKLWLTNGNDSVRIFDGTTVTVLDGTGGTPNVPKGRYIAYHDERVWLYHQPSGRSLCSFSALTDNAANIITPDDPNAWPNDNNLQISEGDADYGTGLLLYRGYLHFFKQYSIWRLVGYDEYTYTRVKTRASTGSRFSESLQIIDSLVHLIGVDGIYVFDGEESERISDIIDPATAEQTAFGFNQLQQPNTNNLFWETESTLDFNSGSSVPQNLLIDNAATVQAKDNSQSDFLSGALINNLDLTTNPGFIQLQTSGGGLSTTNVVSGLPVTVTLGNGDSEIGNSIWITDGDFVNRWGLSGVNRGTFTINFNEAIYIGQIVLKGLISGNSGGGTVSNIEINYIDGLDNPQTLFISGTSFGTIAPGQPNEILFPPSVVPIDTVISFVPVFAKAISILMQSFTGITITECQVFATAYYSDGQFISRTLDYGYTPNSLGNFFASVVDNGETVIFQTQTSADGTGFDAPVDVAVLGPIASIPRRYIRWIANFVSDGLATPVIDYVFVGTFYQSATHDTGGNIFAWGAFEADRQLRGQTITFYYRGATTSVGVLSAPWNVIVPGGAIAMDTLNRYIQFKFEISGITPGNLPPSVESVTINWVSGSGTQPQVLQNVASFFWRNRYWLSAAGPGATANNTILVRGKKTFQSPWQLKDWNILSMCRYLDNFYGTSSLDGSIYQLDTGYSKDGSPLNSVFETGDFTFKGFQVVVVEIMIELQRNGPYNLLIGTSTDQGQTWVDHSASLTQVAGYSYSYWYKINGLNLTTDKMRLRFLINGIDQPWQVHNAVVYYKMTSARGTIH